jgi:hypothetical protein
MTLTAEPPRTIFAPFSPRMRSTRGTMSLMKNRGFRMSLLSIFLTERPTTSGFASSIARETAPTGSLWNMRSSTLVLCPACSAAWATIHAPAGMTGTGREWRLVLMMRMFILLNATL